MRFIRGLVLLVMLLMVFPAAAAAGSEEDSSITLYYEENAQVEIISPEGVRVMIDVFNPTALSTPPTEDDVLLTTHTHSDHYYPKFIDAFPGQAITVSVGELSVGDVEITSISSAHLPDIEMQDENGSNYIFIIDVAGLRIAHFGDIGQDELTEEQLEALGEVDLAITQFSNSYSAMDLINLKGFNLMDQVNPKLIIPTHFKLDALEVAVEKEWEGFQAQEWPITIEASMLLDDQTRFIAVGVYAKAAANMYEFPDWSAVPTVVTGD
ncbi:MAG: MBL fold metallo-hydrolase [Chloroflexi bacterium]|nr:MBL fold metallo-hydrolase [Chloroflexota bacterium]